MTTGEKYFSLIICVPILLSALFGYYKNVGAMKGDGAISSLQDALAYVESHWQEGDVIYATDDGPWVNLRPYTGKPMYKMPECEVKGSYAPVLGSLAPATRDALGVLVADLNDVPYVRAWVFAPSSPLHPVCYYLQIQLLTASNPVYVVDDSQWLKSAVWLVEE